MLSEAVSTPLKLTEKHLTHQREKETQGLINECNSTQSKATEANSSNKCSSQFYSQENDLLQKKRHISFNFFTGKFEREGEDQSTIVKKEIKNEYLINNFSKSLKIKVVINGEKKNYDLSIATDCRKFQLDSLLSHKLKSPPIPKENEYCYKEFEDLTKIDISNYCDNLQAILINPHWKNASFDIEKIVIKDNLEKHQISFQCNERRSCFYLGRERTYS